MDRSVSRLLPRAFPRIKQLTTVSLIMCGTRGLLSHLQNEAQLAVVLGHEIGHVAVREGYDAAEGAEFFRSLKRISEQQGATRCVKMTHNA